jgi:hypothetical protein
MTLDQEKFKSLYQLCDLQIKEVEEVVKRGHVEMDDFDSVNFRNQDISYHVLDLIYNSQHSELLKQYLNLVLKFVTHP